MNKEYKLKNGVELKELEKYGYSMFYGMFYQDFGKMVKETKIKETIVIVRHHFKTVDVYVRDKLHLDIQPKFGFGKRELPFIKDLLDADLLEEIKPLKEGK